MCAVYRVRWAEDPSIERAIKVMIDDNPGAAERFSAEARLLISLDHPNVLKVYELIDEEPPWIVMELLAGRDLEEHRDTVDPLRPDKVAEWFADLANGLQKVHDLGVVHRDLKPSNVMLGTDGVPRLIDFGVARDTSAARVTKAGIVVGTASYLPPELFMDSDPQHLQDQPEADVYSLAQTLCELLINRPIHDPERFQGPKLLVMIMQDKITRPFLDPREWDSNIPDGLAAIVIDATEQLPEDRIRSAKELERRLRVWLAERRATDRAPLSRATAQTLPPPPASRPASPTPRPRRSGLLGGLLGVGGLGLVGLGLVSIVALGAIGVAVLVQFAPDASERAVRTSLQATIASQSAELYACVEPPSASAFSLAIDTDSGSIRGVEVRGITDALAVRCLEDRVGAWNIPNVERPVRVEVPIRFH